MDDEKNRPKRAGDEKRMVPPRLTVVPRDDEMNDNEPVAERDEADEASVRVGAEPAHAAEDAAPAPAPAPAEPRAATLDAALAALPSADRREKLRIVEALLFASAEPLDEKHLATFLKPGDDVPGLLKELQAFYAARGVNLVKTAGAWMFRTAEDLSYLLERQTSEERKLSRAALETLAIVAYHQPVTRAEIEEIRGVQTSPGTLDILLETGWVRPRGRRRAPGRPLTYGTTASFLAEFGLDTIKDLPGLADLRGAGLLDGNLPPGFTVPQPTDIAALMPDELPLEAEEEEDVQAEMPLDLQDEDEAVNPGDEPPPAA